MSTQHENEWARLMHPATAADGIMWLAEHTGDYVRARATHCNHCGKPCPPGKGLTTGADFFHADSHGAPEPWATYCCAACFWNKTGSSLAAVLSATEQGQGK